MLEDDMRSFVKHVMFGVSRERSFAFRDWRSWVFSNIDIVFSNDGVIKNIDVVRSFIVHTVVVGNLVWCVVEMFLDRFLDKSFVDMLGKRFLDDRSGMQVRSLGQMRDDSWDNRQSRSEEVVEFVSVDGVEKGRVENVGGVRGGIVVDVVNVVVDWLVRPPF